MYRKLLVAPLLVAALVSCGSSEEAARTGSGAVTNTASAPAAAATTGATADATANCPTSATKRFAKTRFVADAGLAFGAVNQWIVKPYRAGTFQSGAQGRKTALVKAVAAGAFAINRLNAAGKLVNADPTLCKTLKAPFDAVRNSVTSLTDSLKSGDVAGIAGASAALEGLRQTAKTAGVDIQDKSVPAP